MVSEFNIEKVIIMGITLEMMECILRKNCNNWETRQKSDQLIYQCISPGNWIYVAAEAKSLPYSSNVTNGLLY